MGDHRASIKIEMKFHGIEDKADMWINYSPEGDYNMDRRVVDFFNGVYKRGMVEYNKIMEEYWDNKYKEDIEIAEKRELKRLKEKYEREER